MEEILNELMDNYLSQVFESKNDPNGSYTGTTTDEDYLEPDQDADDL